MTKMVVIKFLLSYRVCDGEGDDVKAAACVSGDGCFAGDNFKQR